MKISSFWLVKSKFIVFFFSCMMTEEEKKLTKKEYNGFDENVSLESLRKEIIKFADERDWNQFHQPRNLLLAMVD